MCFFQDPNYRAVESAFAPMDKDEKDGLDFKNALNFVVEHVIMFPEKNN